MPPKQQCRILCQQQLTTYLLPPEWEPQPTYLPQYEHLCKQFLLCNQTLQEHWDFFWSGLKVKTDTKTSFAIVETKTETANFETETQMRVVETKPVKFFRSLNVQRLRLLKTQYFQGCWEKDSLRLWKVVGVRAGTEQDWLKIVVQQLY